MERSRVVADTVERARKEDGELQIPIEEGLLSWDDVLELGDVVAGDVPGRTDGRELTLFTSGGIGVEYLVVAREVYERACEADAGTAVTVDLESDHL